MSALLRWTRKNTKPSSTNDPSSVEKTLTNLTLEQSKKSKQEARVATFFQQARITAPAIAAAAAIGIGVQVPGLVPVLLSVGLSISILLRQKSLNSELKANLGYIQLETERMLRTISVIQEIAKERGIPLNETSLCLSLEIITKKLMTMADLNTQKLLKDMRVRPTEERVKLVRILNQSTRGLLQDASRKLLTGQPDMPVSPFQSFTRKTKKFFMFWVSPQETMRQIMNDLTIALGWYSILISEFDIFMRYMDTKGVPAASKWKDSDAAKDMFTSHKRNLAEKQQNVSKYASFFNVDTTEDAARIVFGASQSVLLTNEMMQKEHEQAYPEDPSQNMSSNERW